MINVYIYNEQTGEIKRTFFTTDPESVTLNLISGEQAVDFDSSFANPYVVNGQLLERPDNPSTLNGLVIENVPLGATVSFDDQSYVVDDGTAELGFQFPGTYTVSVTCFPYLTKNFEVIYES